MKTVPARMKAARVLRYDREPGALVVEEVPVPAPGPDKVLVKMELAPINPSDLMYLRGEYGFRLPPPVTPGFEGLGRVVAGGGLLGRMLRGRRVAVGVQKTAAGTWAEYCLTRPSLCLPLPESIPDEQGAMMLVNPITALCFTKIIARGGHRAAIHNAAAGSLGRLFLRLTRDKGIPVIHIVRRQAQRQTLEALGAEHVLDASDPGFDAALKKRASALNATIAFDPVAGPWPGRLLAAMPDGAAVMAYGDLSGEPCLIPAERFVFRRQSVSGFWLSDWVDDDGLIKTAANMLSMRRLIAGGLTTQVAGRFPLSEVAEAAASYEGAMSAGKVLLTLA